MLAFIGTLASKDLLSSTQLTEITRPLLYFGCGVASAVVASAAAYFTNLMIAVSSNRKSRHYDIPFVRDTSPSDRRTMLGEIFRYIGAVAVAASIGCFVLGLVKAEVAFNTLATEKKPVMDRPGAPAPNSEAIARRKKNDPHP